MGSDWSRNPGSRDLIIGGLRFAEKGEFLEAIDLWEEALSVGSTGSTEAAYLCIALLEDHLRALHEGDELPFPDFREKLAEIGFDALDHPTRPLQEAATQANSSFDDVKQAESTELGKQPRYNAAAPPPPAHRPQPLAESDETEDDSDLWEIPDPPSGELQLSQESWAASDDDRDPSGNALKPIHGALGPTKAPTSVELELPNPIQPASVRLGQMHPGRMRAESVAKPPPDEKSADEGPLADPFDVLRKPDESLPELPPPRDYAEEPEERPLSFDLDPLASQGDRLEDSDSGVEDFEIVIDDSGGFDQAPLKPWERADDSGVLDLAENERLPDTGTHDWGQGTPWSAGEGVNAGFGPARARHRLKATHTSDRAFDELDLPDDPTGQLEDEVLKEALTHHELGDYQSSQSLIEEHLSSFPSDPRLDDLRKENLRQIEMKYLAKIGSLEGRPVVAISADQLVWHNLNQDKGFVLSRVDGKLTVADIVDIVHLSRHETLRLLAELTSDGIIHFA